MRISDWSSDVCSSDLVKRFGIQQPIVANDRDEVIIGQPLFLAAQEIGIAEVPVIRLKAIGQLEAQALSVAYARLGEIGKPDQAKIGEIMLCWDRKSTRLNCSH